ncbi:hypothetical protein AGR1B_Lc50040 [Agrobacterium fabacearum S56]|nr:hypothetical protein AGR1B_Lc50040 [Agrobacterium fabacearum S56]
MLTRQPLGLRQKALRLARLRHVGFDPTWPGAKAVLVVGAHGRVSSQNSEKSGDIRL